MRILTAPGVSGVAVAAFDAGERDAVAALLQTRAGRPFDLGRPAPAGAGAPALPPPRLATLALGGEVLDEVLVVDRGEAGVELHLHGSPAVVAALASAFSAASPAGAATGWASAADRLLRVALAIEQLELALEQRAQPFDVWLAGRAALPAADRGRQLAAALARSRVALAHVEPCRLVLAGAQNAGKSTLFNRLLFRERALAGPLPGLTRDPLRETTTLAGYPYELVDTAGEGEVASAVDAAAIARGRELRTGAVVLRVIDGSRGPLPADRAPIAAAAAVLVVVSKLDLPRAPWPTDLAVDLEVAAAAESPAALRARLGERLRRWRSLPPAGPVGGPAALSRGELDRLTALAALAP